MLIELQELKFFVKKYLGCNYLSEFWWFELMILIDR